MLPTISLEDQMKIRQSNSDSLTVKVYIHENKKEETFLVSIPDIFFSIQFDYELYGESLTEYLLSLIHI